MTVVPEVLFKYKSLRNKEELKRVIDAIENHHVYAASARKLNDPSEGVSITIVLNRAGGSVLPLTGNTLRIRKRPAKIPNPATIETRIPD